MLKTYALESILCWNMLMCMKISCVQGFVMKIKCTFIALEEGLDSHLLGVWYLVKN